MTQDESKKCIKLRLKNYSFIVMELQQLEKLMSDLQCRILPGQKAPDGMPLAHGKCSDLSGIVTERLVLMDRYSAKIAELQKVNREIEDMIDVLDPMERTLIRLRYIEGHTWEEVSDIMAYTQRQIHRIHACALDKLAQKSEYHF